MPRLILFVLLAGVVIYGLVWLSMRLRDRRAAAAPQRPAPDDDPQFLAQLDARLREQRRQAEAARRRREAEAEQENQQPDPEKDPTQPDEADEPNPTDADDDAPDARPS
ncbi:hypothetical protein [Litorihabitans aurantiacus]|uniref:Uncharacterized protein n=1 Tax=Litorihabitans aurantiacus TaxID=1930061 RepID=A0AA37XG08_9MICO|nr:hypothetical protein [Litorihabitans aurantiacus]GMA32404.1 hypothetical protein GCM10025875_23960 [Litorihabitans aurantiacus]